MKFTCTTWHGGGNGTFSISSRLCAFLVHTSNWLQVDHIDLDLVGGNWLQVYRNHSNFHIKLLGHLEIPFNSIKFVLLLNLN